MMITSLWARQPGAHFVLCTKSAGGKWQEHWFTRKQFDEVRDFLRDNDDKDLYFCPHGFDRQKREKQYAAIPKLLWADLDEVDPRKVALKPTIAIESSPGRYVGLWLLKDNMDEELNRRLTYFIGADKGGWDLTQVLRIPGTTNYKYKSTPRVKLMWDDGPAYSVRDVEKTLPEEEDEDTGLEAAEVWRKYEDTMPRWLRREIFDGKPRMGQRSEMLWKMANTMVEKGMTEDEVFTVLKTSPWNKFKGRSSEDKQLRRELHKIFANHLKGGAKKPRDTKEKNGYNFLEVSLDEVEEEQIDWIWYPYLARGEVTIIEGDPGVGKSYLAQMIAKAICDGERLPSVKPVPKVQGKVAYFDTENNASTITKPRLRYNNCQHMENYYQEEEPFSIDDEDAMPHVFDALEKLRPVAAFFDTVNLYIGGADTGKANETTQALATFKEIAKRYNCSVVILRHLTKGNSKEKALYRGQGNIAFAGVARILMTVGTDPQDNDIKIVAVTKLNMAKHPKALQFTISALPDTLKERDRSKFAWGEFVDLTSDEILQPAEKNNDRDDAKAFLQEALEDNEREVNQVEVMAEKRSISRRTLHRAADELGVIKRQTGYGKDKVSMWSLA